MPVQESETSGNLLNQLGGVAGLAGLALPTASGGNLEVKLAEITSREFAEKYIYMNLISLKIYIQSFGMQKQ